MYASRYFVRPGAALPAAATHDVFGRLLRSLDDNATSSGWQPAVDIREEAERFVILADVPGVDPASIEVSMDKNVLSLSGTRGGEPLPEGVRLSRGERGQGAFERRFVLPEGADAAAIVASSRHGVLELSIPKKAQLAPRRIEVSAAH